MNEHKVQRRVESVRHRLLRHHNLEQQRQGLTCLVEGGRVHHFEEHVHVLVKQALLALWQVGKGARNARQERRQELGVELARLGARMLQLGRVCLRGNVKPLLFGLFFEAFFALAFILVLIEGRLGLKFGAGPRLGWEGEIWHSLTLTGVESGMLSRL